MDLNLVAVGERARAARCRLGVSQRAVQEASGVPQSTLYRLEAGVRTTVTLSDVDRLAEALGLTLQDLLYGSPVRERIEAAVRVPEGTEPEAVLDHAVTLLELDDLLDRVVPGLRQKRRRPGIVVPSRGAAEACGVDVAAQVRELLGLGVAPVTGLTEVVEELTGVDVGTTRLPAGVSGVSALDPQRDTAVLLINSAEAADRQRFMLAHELGHLLFGDPAHVHAQRPRRTVAEIRCDAFARNFLVPCAGVESWLERRRGAAQRQVVDERQLALMARRFGVAPEVIGSQLDRMKLRPPALASLRSGRSLAYRYGWGQQYDRDQAAAMESCVPRRILDRAIEAFQAGRLGIPALARLQGRPVAEVAQTLAEVGIEAHPTIRRADISNLVRIATS